MEKPSEQQMDAKIKKEDGQDQNERMRESEIGGGADKKTGVKPIVFKEDNASAEAFLKDMCKFVDNVRELTPYTVNGLSLVFLFQ